MEADAEFAATVGEAVVVALRIGVKVLIGGDIMPAKKKKILNEEEEEVISISPALPDTTEVMAEAEQIVPEKAEEKPLEPKLEDSDLIKVRVKIGSFGFEQGVFQKGETFTVTRERLSKFDPNDVEVIA
jgi:hypothetical protein